MNFQCKSFRHFFFFPKIPARFYTLSRKFFLCIGWCAQSYTRNYTLKFQDTHQLAWNRKLGICIIVSRVAERNITERDIHWIQSTSQEDTHPRALHKQSFEEYWLNKKVSRAGTFRSTWTVTMSNLVIHYSAVVRSASLLIRAPFQLILHTRKTLQFFPGRSCWLYKRISINRPIEEVNQSTIHSGQKKRKRKKNDDESANIAKSRITLHRVRRPLQF